MNLKDFFNEQKSKKESKQINNIPENNFNQFFLEFMQLIAYYNCIRKIKEALTKGVFIDEEYFSNNKGRERINEGFIQNKFYLIDKNWLEQWKKHVGYQDICTNCLQKNINRNLTQNDFNWIKPYIEKNTKENKLPILDNKIIYNIDKIDPLSNFEIIDKESFESFIFGFNNNSKPTKSRTYPVKILKKKLLLMFDLLSFQIIFKDNDSNLYFEILIIFEQNNEGRKKTLDKIEGIDINEWIKNSEIKLISDFNKEFDFFNCKFKLINKTLLLHKNNQLKNCISPNLNNEGILIDNNASISNGLKMEMTQKIMSNLRNKNKINKNNNKNINNFGYGNIILNNNQKDGNLINLKYMNNSANQLIMQNNNNENWINFQNMNNFINSQIMPNNYDFQKMINFNNQHLILYNNQNNLNWINNQNIFKNQLIGNQKNIIKQNKTKKEKKFQNKTGLMNIGQSCYMNASIQCLCGITELTKYLIKLFLKQSIDIENQPLTAAYSSLLYELFYPKKNEKYISPKLFKEIIGELNPLFKGMHAADAKDLIFFIIEKLHKELNPINLGQQQNHQIDFQQQELNSINEQIMLKLFIQDFQAKNKTIISDLFYGINRSTMKCEFCGVTKYSFQAFNLLIFQLKKVKEEKLKQLGGFYDDFKDKLNLIDAFNADQREELLEGENMIYCNNCKSLRNGKHQQKIYMLPQVIIIILNRGKNNEDFNEEFEFPLDLDLSKQGIIINQQACHKYYLSGVITHLGESGASGHFIAYFRDASNSKFLCYNDSSVNPVKNEDVIQTIISRKDYEKKTPYILFYHQLEN